MSNIQIKDIKFTMLRGEAIQTMRIEFPEMIFSDCIELCNKLEKAERDETMFEIHEYDERGYRKFLEFNIVKTPDELEQLEYNRKKEIKTQKALEWFETLTDEQKEFVYLCSPPAMG